LRVTPLPAAKQDAIRTQKTKPPDFVLLPESEITTFTKYSVNQKIQVQSWEPTVADIYGAEANLPQISALGEKEHDSNWRIDNPNQYFRQYLAIVLDGKKLIFVNAFCSIEQGDSNDWRKHLVFVIGGGKCFWHATYDPSTKKFSNLIINAVA
jgi:hypothetical protein